MSRNPLYNLVKRKRGNIAQKLYFCMKFFLFYFLVLGVAFGVILASLLGWQFSLYNNFKECQ
jgi:hypothetical protein